LYSSLYWRRDLRSDISNLRSRYCPPYEGVHEIGGGSSIYSAENHLHFFFPTAYRL